jgi:hypothetical protein
MKTLFPRKLNFNKEIELIHSQRENQNIVNQNKKKKKEERKPKRMQDASFNT